MHLHPTSQNLEQINHRLDWLAQHQTFNDYLKNKEIIKIYISSQFESSSFSRLARVQSQVFSNIIHKMKKRVILLKSQKSVNGKRYLFIDQSAKSPNLLYNNNYIFNMINNVQIPQSYDRYIKIIEQWWYVNISTRNHFTFCSINQNQQKKQKTRKSSSYHKLQDTQFKSSKGGQHFAQIKFIIFTQLGSLLSSKKIKRSCLIANIEALTLSMFGYQFVIHCPQEYDFHYSSSDFRNQIIETLLYAQEQQNVFKLPLYQVEAFALNQYVRTQTDKKKHNQVQMPKEAPSFLTSLEYKQQQQDNVKQSTLIFVNPTIQKPIKEVGLEDFEMLSVLGRGAFGKVTLCQKMDTKQLFAIKAINKQHIIDNKQVEHTKAEKKILEMVDSPFLVSMHYSFQSKNKIFFVMPYMRGGDLFRLLKENIRFNEQTAKFYAASIILGLEYLHNLGVVYRDIKGENILLDQNGYIKITDYGLAKFLQPNELTRSFVGTLEYLAPEIIIQNGHDQQVDWWSLGILLYEMVIGKTPFFAMNQNQLLRSIVQQDLVFPAKPQISQECKDLIQNLLKKSPNERLNGAQKIKSHPWFSGFSPNNPRYRYQRLILGFRISRFSQYSQNFG
ncbi:hypothetical protein pb186bvf_006582 [Paramecium bursaria]